MVKFASHKDEGYEKVSEYLQILAEEAPDAIGARWKEQSRIQKGTNPYAYNGVAFTQLVTIIAAQTDGKENFSLPFSLSGVPEIKQFVGRKEELFKIKEAFQGDGSQLRVVILHGLGGIGKTQLAVAFMKEQRDAYTAIFWLNGKSEDTLTQSFASMAKRLYNKYPSSMLLKTAAEEKNANKMVAAIQNWLSMEKNTQWILVFDNVDNPKLSGIEDPQAYDIRSYFPEACQGSILITTRSSRLKIGKVVSVKKFLDVQESITILTSTSERIISDQGTCNHQHKRLITD